VQDDWDDDIDGDPFPCPICGVRLRAVGEDETAHWFCVGCGRLMPSDGLTDRRTRIRSGDLIASRADAREWHVAIGGIAPVGTVYRGVGAWVATRRPDQFDAAGNVYADRGIPLVLGLTNTLDEALALYPAATSG
jgi:hypothetical protein